MKLTDGKIWLIVFIIIFMQFIIGCSGNNPSKIKDKEIKISYRVKVILGAPEGFQNHPEKLEEKTVLNGFTEIGKPFGFTSPDKTKTIKGLLSITEDGTFHFKGSVHVFSTAGVFDQDITLSKGYQPPEYVFSSVIQPFYIIFEKI